MKGRYEHVLGFALDHPWAITPSMLSVVASIIGRHVAGHALTAEELQAALVDRKNLPAATGGGAVAVIPIYGVVAPRMNLLSDFSGGTTFETLTGQLRDAVANKAIKTIVLDINSPGGSVAGATEFAREVMKARTKKPIIAQIQYTGASAAYWAAAAATEIQAAPSAQIGSIGIYTLHDDISQALKQLGITRTFIYAGDGKDLNNDAAKLSEHGLARIQGLIDTAYGQFVGDVIKGRGKGMTADRVKKEWGAHIYGADQALALGMIDGIATLDDTIARVMTPADGARATQHPSTTAATLQEPSSATSQEPLSDAHWQNGIDAALLELEL